MNITNCAVHSKVDIPKVYGAKFTVLDESLVKGYQTGTQSGFYYCTLCGLVVDSDRCTDDPVDPPPAGSYVDVDHPELFRETGYTL